MTSASTRHGPEDPSGHGPEDPSEHGPEDPSEHGPGTGFDLLPQGEPIDLTNCDREPIHIPGAVQPHGVLLALRGAELNIMQVSANCAELLGRSPQSLLGQPLETLLEPRQLEVLRDGMQDGQLEGNPLYVFSLHLRGISEPLDAVAHSVGDTVLLELERPQPQAPATDFYRLTRQAVTALERSPTLEAFCQTAAREVRRITGLDRVMVYRFAEDGSGEVVAEEKVDALEPFLGLHYPASDIPQQARALYVLSTLRLIGSNDYTPVPMLALDPHEEPLDMSHAFLRSVSPIHLEYLRNMGVAASMSISIVHDGALWGLIACHHRSPVVLGYPVRAACEFLGRVVSLLFKAKQQGEHAEYRARLGQLSARLIERLDDTGSLLEALTQPDLNLLDDLDAPGAAVVLGGAVVCLGRCPPVEFVHALTDWLAERPGDHVLATPALAQLFPPAHAHLDSAAGMLALRLSRGSPDCVIWFRPEVLQQVRWGGNPEKPVQVSAGGERRLSPRTSFAAWSQQVAGRSLPWVAAETEAAEALRLVIVGAVLRRAESLAKLNSELERSNAELDSFAYIASHDLKEPLRGIHNYSSFLLEGYREQLDPEGVSKLETLVRLTQRMENLLDSLLLFSRVGRVDFSFQETPLSEVLEDVLEVLRPRLEQSAVQVRLATGFPTVRFDRVRVREVFSNLISNSVKYNDKPERWLEVGCLAPEARGSLAVPVGVPDHAPIFWVRDNGIGIRERHFEAIFRIFKRLHARDQYGGGTGAGLSIVKKIVERHGGQVWLESEFGVGTTFYFTLEGEE